MADSLILLLQTITTNSAQDEFHPSYHYALTMAVYAGMLLGALFWGTSADIIGRRFAFNVSLFISSIFAIAGGASPNWTVLALFVAISAFGAGGNLILDTTIFLEYLPSHKQWLLTLMAMWWGFAPVIAAAFAWPFLSEKQWNCNEQPGPCTYDNNKVRRRFPLKPPPCLSPPVSLQQATNLFSRDGASYGTPTARSCS